MAEVQRIAIRSDLDIVAARVEGRNLAREMGFGIIDQARIATAISELARNAILYAQGGEIVLSRKEPNGKQGLEIVCQDQGPGIANMEQIMGHIQAVDRELSMGLPGTRRLMDEFQIQSEPGSGTRVTVCKWLR